MIADASTKTAILNLVQEYTAGYAGCDVKRVMALYPIDPAITVFADGHKYIGRDQIEAMVDQDMSSLDAIYWQFAPLLIYVTGPVAWVVAEASAAGKTGGQSVSLGAYRITWVCERREQQWYIVHAHVSSVTVEG